MKWILRILAAPVVILLAVFVWGCAFLLSISAYIFGLLGTLLGLLGFLVLLTGATTNGIVVLVMAFLISPMGLPMLAAWLLGKIQGLRYLIQDAIYG